MVGFQGLVREMEKEKERGQTRCSWEETQGGGGGDRAKAQLSMSLHFTDFNFLVEGDKPLGFMHRLLFHVWNLPGGHPHG